MTPRTRVSAGVVVATLVGAATAVQPVSSDRPLMQLSTLSPTAGEPVEVRLNLPTGENWADANVGAFFVRQGKEQWSVPIEPVAGGDVIRYLRPAQLPPIRLCVTSPVFELRDIPL